MPLQMQEVNLHVVKTSSKNSFVPQESLDQSLYPNGRLELLVRRGWHIIHCIRCHGSPEHECFLVADALLEVSTARNREGGRQ